MTVKEEITTGEHIAFLENGSRINRYSHVLKGAEIGENVMIGEHCYIGSQAKIGDNTRIQNGVNVWDGVEIGNNVFVGPNTTFTNHHDPAIRETFKPEKTIVKDNATLCAACVIISPCVIGKNATVGAACLVLSDVPDYERRISIYTGRILETK